MSDKSRILLIEDNDFVRMQIAKFLQDENYEVVESSDGEEGLGKFDASISLAIVDVRMEPMGGFDFVKNLRARDINTPVIFVTGDNNADLLPEAGKLNVAAVLMKPVQRDRLVMTVSRTLDHWARTSKK